MAYTFVFNLPHGTKGIARLFVKNGGQDEVQLLYERPSLPRALALAEWFAKNPGQPWRLATFSGKDAAEYVADKNKHWHDEARRLASKGGA
jgi:hypothetical protein